MESTPVPPPPTSPAPPQPIGSTESPITPNAAARPFRCEICNACFKYRGNLNEHVNFYHKKGQVACSECTLVFPTSQHLRKHRAEHSLELGRCPHCRRMLVHGKSSAAIFKDTYDEHLDWCTRKPSKRAKSILNSELIERVFSKRSDDDDPVNCNVFLSPQTHDYEVSDNNNGSPCYGKYFCILCAIEYETEDEFGKHLYNEHQNVEPPFMMNDTSMSPAPNVLYSIPQKQIATQCKICKMKFADKEIMMRHKCSQGGVNGDNSKPNITAAPTPPNTCGKGCKRTQFGKLKDLLLHCKTCPLGKKSSPSATNGDTGSNHLNQVEPELIINVPESPQSLMAEAPVSRNVSTPGNKRRKTMNGVPKTVNLMDSELELTITEADVTVDEDDSMADTTADDSTAMELETFVQQAVAKPNRLPLSAVSNLDAWLLEGISATGGRKMEKVICAECYKSCGDETGFVEHAWEEHKRYLSKPLAVQKMVNLPKDLMKKMGLVV